MSTSLLKPTSPKSDSNFIMRHRYPTGQKYSLELMFAKFATAKIAKDLNPLKISSNKL